jgi:hypothetical protein
MLSAYGAAIVAYLGDGFVIHEHCAVERYGELTVAKADRGLANTADLSPLSRYTVESQFSDEGLTCDHCTLWIVEPEWLVEDES